MSKKFDPAASLKNILDAKRGKETISEESAPLQAPPPSPAPVESPPAPKGRGGKSSDPKYVQCSVYLLRTTRKRVNRALDDEDAGRDFSELVETLLNQWLESST